MIREIQFCLSLILLLTVFTVKAQEHRQLDYIRIDQTSWFDGRLYATYICKPEDSSTLKYHIQEKYKLGYLHEITTVQDDVYDSLVAYVAGYKSNPDTSYVPCSACYEILHEGLTSVKYKTRTDAESKLYFETFLDILLKKSNETRLNGIIKHGILRRLESDPVFKKTSGKYVKITTTALNRDKYYPPIVICSDTSLPEILKKKIWTVFLIEGRVYARLENYIEDRIPLYINQKGRCDHCFDISIFEKEEKIIGYEVNTNERSKLYVAEIEEILKQSSDSDYLISLIKGYLSFRD